VSNPQKLSQFLAEYNLWRRGGIDQMSSCHTAVEIGIAIDEAVDLLKKYDELKRDELRKLRAELACSCNAEELLQVRSDNAALRHSEENLAATVRRLEFELEKAEKATAMLRGTVEALGDANDRLARHAMREANMCGAGYDIDEELREARLIIDAARKEGGAT
jgi:hypothetical protein